MSTQHVLPVLAAALTISCAASPRVNDPLGVSHRDAIAQVYYWRARPGKFEEYSRYVRDVGEKIDAIAGRAGAFLSVTTYVSTDSTTPWTHMRVFILRDSAQLGGLTDALVRAGLEFEPDSARRMERAMHAASLRDRVGSAVLKVLR